MQNIHTLSEDVEPPSTDSRRSESKGYRASKTPVSHESLHGWNLFFKTFPLKKNRLERKNSLSSCFVPIIARSADFSIQAGERPGLSDEDDEYPPSASTGNGSLSHGLSNYHIVSEPGCWCIASRGEIPYTRHKTGRVVTLTDVPRTGRAAFLLAAAQPPALFLPYVTYVSRFRTVPSGRLAPPGIAS